MSILNFTRLQTFLSVVILRKQQYLSNLFHILMQRRANTRKSNCESTVVLKALIQIRDFMSSAISLETTHARGPSGFNTKTITWRFMFNPGGDAERCEFAASWSAISIST